VSSTSESDQESRRYDADGGGEDGREVKTAGRKNKMPLERLRRPARLRLVSAVVPDTASAIHAPARLNALATVEPSAVVVVEVDVVESVGEVGVTSRLRGTRPPVTGSTGELGSDCELEPDQSLLCLGTDMENGPTSNWV